MCRNEKNGACIFGSHNCWFIHDDKEVTFESDKTLNEVNEKVYGMMEKMTERILLIDKSI